MITINIVIITEISDLKRQLYFWLTESLHCYCWSV